VELHQKKASSLALPTKKEILHHMNHETKYKTYNIDGVTVRVNRTFGKTPIEGILSNIATARLKEKVAA